MTEKRVEKGCGRIDKHLAHYWRGSKIWEQWVEGGGRWVRPVYWCKGYVITEGGNR